MILREPPLLLHVFPSFAVGGAQTRFAAIANRFGREFRHAVIAMDGNLGCAGRLSPALDVIYPAVQFRKKAWLANLRTCRRLMHELRPGVLITSNWGSIEWALANRLPVTRHLHMEDGFGPEESRVQLRRRVVLRRLALRRSTVLLPSRTLLRIARDVWRLDPRRLRYLPNGVDLGGAAGEAGPPDGLPVIGTVAVLRAEKNLARLVRAFARLAVPSRLVIVGDGPDRAALEALSQALGIGEKVHFAGYLPAPQACYRQFDVFALSSDTEQMPLSVLEAMAAALPVASTDVGDVRDMLAPENQAFVVPPTEAALADALNRLLGDAGVRKTVGAANLAKVRREYDQEDMFRRHRDLWLGEA